VVAAVKAEIARAAQWVEHPCRAAPKAVAAALKSHLPPREEHPLRATAATSMVAARTLEAEVKAKAAAENVNDLQNRITRDVRVAYLNATTAYDRMALTQQLLQQAQLSLDLAQTRYDLGLGSIVELSTAQLNVTSARIADASAHYDYQSQRILVDYQTGVLR